MSRSVGNAPQAVLAAAKEILAKGLVEGTSGNISARQEDGTVCEYAMSGNEDVGRCAVDALQGRGAALIANHGLVAVGPSPAEAMHITASVERSAFIIWGARQRGDIHHLPEKVDRQFAGAYEWMGQN